MIRYTQTGGVGGIWATNDLQISATTQEPGGWVQLYNERDSSLAGGDTAQWDWQQLSPTGATWYVVDLTNAVAPWASSVQCLFSLSKAGSAEDMELYTRAYHGAASVLGSGQEQMLRMRAERNTPNGEILLRVVAEVPCAGGKFMVLTPSGPDADNIDVRARAYR